MVGLGYSAQIQSYGRLLRNGSLAFTDLSIIPDGYLNFGVTTPPTGLGSSGYGFRDNAGVIQYKNSGGSWQSFPTGGAAPDDAKYILQTPDAALASAQAMSALGSGLVFSTTATGVQSTVASVATGQVLVSNGTGVAPVYSANPSLSSIVFAGGQVLAGTTANLTDLRNGASGQKLRVFGSYTDAANNSYAYLEDAGGTVARLNTAKAGSGTASDLYLGAGDFSRWIIAAASPHFVPNSNNTADLGSSGSQVRSGYFGTSVVAPVVRGSSATILTLSTDGKLTVTNSAASAGVLWDYTTNGLAKLFPTTGTVGALGNLQLGRGTAALKALRFVRGNDLEEATFGFHADTSDTNNLVFGVSAVNRVSLSNATGKLGVIVASDAGLFFSTTTSSQGTVGAFVRSGTGDPEGVVTANVGSLWLRTDGGAGTIAYVKNTGTGNTGWGALS